MQLVNRKTAPVAVLVLTLVFQALSTTPAQAGSCCANSRKARDAAIASDPSAAIAAVGT